MNNITIETEGQNCAYWVTRFNNYRNSMSFNDAANQIWSEFDAQDNPYLDILPNPTALFFSLLTYIPNRSQDVQISSGPTPITWDSTPIYETTSNWWYSEPVWACSEWKNWHIALEQHYGDTYAANSIWEQAWNHPDNQCAFLGTVFCPDTDLCRYDCGFVTYLLTKDVEIGNLVSNTTCSLSNIVLNIVRTVENVTDTIETVSDTTKKVFPFVTAGVIAFGGYKIYQAL